MYDVLPIFQPESSDDLSGLAITLGLGHVVVLLAHVHVPGGVRGILFATVIEARILLLELLSTTSDVLFALGLTLAHLIGHLIFHFEVFDQTVDKLVLGFHQEVRGHAFLALSLASWAISIVRHLAGQISVF